MGKRGGYLGGSSLVSGSGFILGSRLAGEKPDQEIVTPHIDPVVEPIEFPKRGRRGPRNKAHLKNPDYEYPTLDEIKLAEFRYAHMAEVVHSIFCSTERDFPISSARSRKQINAEIAQAGDIYSWMRNVPGFRECLERHLTRWDVPMAFRSLLMKEGDSSLAINELDRFIAMGGDGKIVEASEDHLARKVGLEEEKTALADTPAKNFTERQVLRKGAKELNAEIASHRRAMAGLRQASKILLLVRAATQT